MRQEIPLIEVSLLAYSVEKHGMELIDFLV
jgi:hypothetical protein